MQQLLKKKKVKKKSHLGEEENFERFYVEKL